MLAAMTEQNESRKQRAARRAGEFPPAPEPLPRPVLDSHTHLDITVSEYGVPPGADRADGADDPVAAAIEVAAGVGVDRLIQVGVDLDSSRWSADVADKYGPVLATVALHPNEAPRLADLDEALREIEALAARDRVRGVGETGMDFFRTGDEGRAAQEESFRAHIAIAKRYAKALVIHDRDAHADVLRILEEEGPPDRVVFHCFSGDVAMAKQCAEAGYVMSFAGNVTFGNAQPLRDAAAAAPAELILAETDAPFLTPVPNRGKPNEPALTADTLRCLAEVKGLDLADLCDTVTATAQRTFGPW